MRLLDLIHYAENALREVGNVEVIMLTDTPDGQFCMDFNPWTDILEVAIDDYAPGAKQPVFAVGWATIQIALNEADGGPKPPEPPARKTKSTGHLHRVK